jgi:hypothetical protein
MYGCAHHPPVIPYTPLFRPRPLPVPAPLWPEPARTHPQVDWTRPHPLDPPPPPPPTTTIWIFWADPKFDRFRRLQPVFMGVTVLFALIEGSITAFLVARNNE